MIRFEGVSKSFDGGRTLAVESLDLEIPQGQLTVLLGESGCGKTTTLKMINRLEEASAGRVVVDGDDVRNHAAHELRRTIGYVIQRVGLFPHMTVAENIGIVPGLLGWAQEAIGERTDELLQLVGLPPGEYRDRPPDNLSGGQQQRVGVARALAGKPRIMLMDEPFGALDPITRDVLQDEYRRIHEELELTTVMVTHDMTEALLLADRIVVMQKGRLLRTGTPEEIMRDPGHEYVRELMETPRRQAERLHDMIEEHIG